jgi:hypothetical protein
MICVPFVNYLLSRQGNESRSTSMQKITFLLCFLLTTMISELFKDNAPSRINNQCHHIKFCSSTWFRACPNFSISPPKIYTPSPKKYILLRMFPRTGGSARVINSVCFFSRRVLVRLRLRLFLCSCSLVDGAVAAYFATIQFCCGVLMMMANDCEYR